MNKTQCHCGHYRGAAAPCRNERCRFYEAATTTTQEYPPAARMLNAQFGDPFSDEALGQRTPEAIAQDDRQAADFGGHDPQYHAALVVIANEEGAGRWARAIDLVSKIWGKDKNQVLQDACSL